MREACDEAQVLACRERLVDGGVTVLLTTQYLEEADRLANQIVVIDHGTVIAEGTANELKARLGATVIEIDFTDEQTLRTAAEKLVGVGGVSFEGRRLRLSVGDGAAAMLETVRVLDGAGLRPTAMARREPTLDDVFLSLTGHAAEEAAAEEEALEDRRAKAGARGRS